LISWLLTHSFIRLSNECSIQPAHLLYIKHINYSLRKLIYIPDQSITVNNPFSQSFLWVLSSFMKLEWILWMLSIYILYVLQHITTDNTVKIVEIESSGQNTQQKHPDLAALVTASRLFLTCPIFFHRTSRVSLKTIQQTSTNDLTHSNVCCICSCVHDSTTDQAASNSEAT